MRKLFTSSLAALLAVSMVLPAMTTTADAGRKGRAVAAGVVLGVAAAALLANSSRANASERRWARQCNRLYNRCMNGNDYACDRFERSGCSE